ncbi:extracellular solute-binding protein [Methylocella silvestris]|uniref:ABC transporter substrate-binding protein n=1 Tax=Methylocella silvestris TaxID=199596 RepID=A0A2J7TMB2_METSI|nr:extracellular solute-binding protein [Methylocella silvestris]PNG27847.1 ABC transporter substrate-binding protein [Methylocella silvestris]
MTNAPCKHRFAALASAVFGVVLALAAPALAQQGPRGAIAMHGEPQLPEDFDHLPYADPGARKGGKLSIGFPGAYDSLNPFNLKAGSTAQGLNGNVFETLMTRSLDEPFTLYGLIAKSVETDADRTHVTFRLNPAAHFSDGTPITSEDVRWTFELLKTRGRPQHRAAYSLVNSVETPDPLTIRYELGSGADREMPLTLALMPVLPRHAVDLAKFDDASLTVPIGSGPYKIAEVKPGERLVLKRDPNYWARDLPVRRGLYNFDEIAIDYFRDANSLFESFAAGLLDYREETSPSRWTSAYDFPAMRDGRDRREALPAGGPKGMEGFVFNLRRPLFDDIRVREALGMMFDFEWINANLYSGLYKRTKSFFDDSELASTGRPASAAERALLAPFPGAVRADILEGKWRPPETDGSGRDRTMPKRALALLEQAGYQLENGKLARDGAPLAFEIMVKDRNQERLALNYADSLARIGVSAKVRLVDEVQYQRRRQKFDFDMMIGSWLASASPGNEQRSRWGSKSADQEASFNLAGVRSAAVDALIAAMLAARGREDFVAAVRAFDRVLLSGFYIVPLFHSSDLWTASSTALTRPAALPAYGSPTGSSTLDNWWRKQP